MPGAAAFLADRDCADDAVAQFIDAARTQRGLSPNTLSAYRADLRALVRWLAQRDVTVMRATREDLEDFIAWRARAGARPTSTARELCAWRRFFCYFVREGVIRDDPTEQIVLPKSARPPRRLLTEQEVEALLCAPVATKPIGNRDRAMLEVLYATGLHVSELVNLRLAQVNLKQGVIRLLDEDNRERSIPLSDRAMGVLKKFIAGVRDEIVRDRRTEYLFPTRQCDHMSRQAFWHIFKRYARKAGLAKRLSPDNLRHAFATHLLNEGADLHAVKAFIGSGDWSASRIYRQALRRRRTDTAA